jgi:hypothetical protein
MQVDFVHRNAEPRRKARRVLDCQRQRLEDGLSHGFDPTLSDRKPTT